MSRYKCPDAWEVAVTCANVIWHLSHQNKSNFPSTCLLASPCTCFWWTEYDGRDAARLLRLCEKRHYSFCLVLSFGRLNRGIQAPCCEEAQARCKSHTQMFSVTASSKASANQAASIAKNWITCFQMLPAPRPWVVLRDNLPLLNLAQITHLWAKFMSLS